MTTRVKKDEDLFFVFLSYKEGIIKTLFSVNLNSVFFVVKNFYLV